MAVTVVSYEQRENKEGKNFFVITLQGDDVRIAQSESGNFYLTADKVTLGTSFNEAMCQMLIGKKLPGSIQKVDCEPYQYTNKEGDVKMLDYKFQYSPKEAASVAMPANPTMQASMGMAA